MTGGARSALRAVRALLLVELREFRRHGRRSLLLLALVAVPVAAVVAGATIVGVTSPTDDERRTAAMGRADLRVEAPAEYAERVRLLGSLPADASVASLRLVGELVEVPGRRLRSRAIVLDSAGPAETPGLTDGSFVLLQGRAPRNAGEVALSPMVLAALDRGPGDRVALEFGAERTITGVVTDPEDTSAALVVRTAAAVEHRGQGFVLVGLPGAAPAERRALARELREAGFDVLERRRVSGEGGDLAAVVFVLGSIGFLEAGLVVAATFIVGLRRRRREIALLGAAGATGRDIGRSLVASTALLAAVGGLVGALLGGVGAALVHPFLDGLNGRLNGPFEVSWVVLGLAIALGVLVAVLATALPASAAARMPIREALGGRRPRRTGAGRSLVVGGGMVGSGVLLLLFAPRDPAVIGGLAVIGGAILGVLGFGVTSPFVLEWLGRLAGRLPLTLRLAVRDAGRFRGRNGPVVTAILAGMSMSVTVAVLVASLDAAIDRLPASYRSDQLLVEGPAADGVAERIAAEWPGSVAARLEAVYVHGEPVRVRLGDDLAGGISQWVAAGDDRLLRALGAEAGLDALRAGHLLRLDVPAGGILDALGISLDVDPSLRLSTWRDGRELAPLPVTRVDVDQRVRGPLYVLHRSTIEGRGWETGPPLDRSISPWLVRLPGPVTPGDLERAQALASESVGAAVDAQLLHRSPARPFYHLVQWLCILTGLIVVLVATALSSVESAADARVLRAVGAPPRVLRGQDAARAGYLALLGCVLALPAGVIPASVFFEASNLPLAIVVPWFDLLVAVLALPTLAYGVAWAMYRGGDRRPTGSRRGAAAGATLVFLVGLASLLAAPAARADEAVVAWEPWVGEAFDGSPLPGELGRIVVPENRSAPDGATIELAFVRYRTTHPHPGPPIVFLAGGPGASGVEFAGRTATHPQLRLLEHADVIGLDQRGTGLGRPELITPPDLVRHLPLDRAVGRDEIVRESRRMAEGLVRFWQSAGIDVAAYNSRESADDVDALRRALGLERIVTFGSSYGSHLALAHLRRHGSTVARAILTNVEGPDATWKLPATVDAALERLHARVLADPVLRRSIPDLRALVETLLRELADRPARVRSGAGEIVVGPHDLRVFLSNALSTAPSTAEIPAHLLAFAAGDRSALADTALANRTIDLALMPWAMDCASGGSPARLAAIDGQRRRADYPLGDAIAAPHYPETCAACPGCDLGASFRAVVDNDVPVLFVSGTLDARTPPANVAAIRAAFRAGAHLVVENAGHESRELMSPEYRNAFQRFLRGGAVEDGTIELPAIPLAATIEAGRAE